MEIFDTHAHILDKVYDELVSAPDNPSSDSVGAGKVISGDGGRIAKREEILMRAAEENFYIIESALNENEWSSAARLSANWDNLYFTVGIHPHNADEYCGKEQPHQWLEGMKDMLISPSARCLAVGETGLDYHYKNSSQENQKKVFRAQIELSLELSKPVVIHCREAYEDCFDILKSYSQKNWRGVIHCFSGGVEEAERFLSLGFYLGITCPVTYPKSEKLKKVVALSPLDRLLTETDSPYLPPAHLRGKRNEPSNVIFVVEEIARIKNIPLEEVAAVTSANARRLFGIG